MHVESQVNDFQPELVEQDNQMVEEENNQAMEDFYQNENENENDQVLEQPQNDMVD